MRDNAPTCQMIANEPAGAGARVLRFHRGALTFTPGQHLSVSPPDSRDFREYSIYSGLDDEYLEILVKEVQGGSVSKKLCGLTPGSDLRVWGPLGFFTLPPEAPDRPLLFIATGTGVSPFRSMVRSYPGLNYTLVHGIRTMTESYGHQDFEPSRLTTCTSRSGEGDFQGRVTAWLENQTIDPQTLVFLCGNCEMIYEVFDLLRGRGLPSRQIFSEVYF